MKEQNDYIFWTCILTVALCLSACAAEVGDSCGSDLECGAGLVCDQSSREGYCTVEDCEYSSCPDGSRCIVFENAESYCMASCASSSDCRDGYSCFTDESAGAYCRQNDE